MKKIIFICSCLLFSFAGTAQPTFEYTDISSGLPGSVRYNDPSVLGQRPVVNIKYDDIDGTPFWNDKWNAAVLVLNNGLVIKADKVKLNLYTNEVLYSDSLGIVMAAETGLIKRIYFFKGSDTTSSPSALYYLKLPDDTVYHYYQVLNYGESQLLKLKNIILYTKEPDALSGKTQLSFASRFNYFLVAYSHVHRLYSISSASIFKIIQKTPEMEEWLSANNNKLRNEEDAVDFLKWLNNDTAK